MAKTIKRDILTLRNRAIILRRIARLNLSNTLVHQDPHNTNHTIDDDKNQIISILTTPSKIETKLHTPLLANITLCLPTLTSNTTPTTNTLEGEAILTCYKDHQVATRLPIKDANRTRCHKYGSALLAMLIKQPRDALKSILNTSLSRNKQQKEKTPTNLSSIRDPET